MILPVSATFHRHHRRAVSADREKAGVIKENLYIPLISQHEKSIFDLFLKNFPQLYTLFITFSVAV
jgi:hypothetical protein